DTANGGKGNDIMVGGRGADKIVSNGGEDILIAGTLDLPTNPLDRFDKMLGLLLDWSQRRNKTQIRPKLVINRDNDVDTVTGSSGKEWFFYDYAEDKSNRKNEPSENIG